VASWPAIARRIRVPLTFAFALIYLWLARPTNFSMLLGGLIVIPGLIVRTLASGHVQKNEQLTTAGPYAYTRNPLYLGSIIIATGFAVASQSWWIAVGMAVIFIAIYVPVIRSEEAFLRHRFPEFEEYARRVPALLPRFRRFNSPAGQFSWDLYRRHREYNAIDGSVAMMVALAAKLYWLSR
jgi:protein-S-isoprenylcysteine O-methyltransferase Ste14